MPTPDFILALRDKIGTELLWLPGVSAVVLDSSGRTLLTRRRDDDSWAVVGGIVEPGEQPARAVIREVEEETGVRAQVERLVSVLSQRPRAYANGDRCQFLDLTFACRYVGGDAHVADDENLAVRWFPLDDLPDLNERNLDRISRTTTPGSTTYYLT